MAISATFVRITAKALVQIGKIVISIVKFVSREGKKKMGNAVLWSLVLTTPSSPPSSRDSSSLEE